MVFWSSFAKKVKQAVSQVSFDALKNRVSNIESKYVKKDESNTLTQTNTFNGQTNFKSKIEFRNPNNNNGAYLDNFDYYNENYTAFKLAKGSTNMLQIECNNTANYVNISAPGTNNGLRISNVSNPTSNDNATNKGYVDGLFNPLNTKVNSVINGLQNGNIVNYAGNYSASTTYHLAQAITYNGDWFVSNIDNNLNHTPTKSNTNYWVYISQPSVDLNLYLTKSEASANYATQNSVNQLETHTTQLVNGLDSRINTNSNNISSLQSTKSDKSYVDDRTIIKYWAPFPATTINSGSYAFLRINNLPRYLNFINAQVQEGITENSDYQHTNVGEVGIKVDIEYSYNAGACFAYVRNNTNRSITIGGQYDDIGSLALYFTRTIVRGTNITITK